MSSGVAVDPDCVAKYQEVKLGRKLAWIVFGLSEKKDSIVVLKTSADRDFDSFLKELPEKDCRWAVFDFEYDAGEGKRSKLVFLHWSPDDANVKAKMIAASSKDAIRKRLDGIQIEIQATDYSEITPETILEKATRR